MTGLRRARRAAWDLLRETYRSALQRAPFLLAFAAFALGVAFVLHNWDPQWEAWLAVNSRPELLKFAQRVSRWGELHLAPGLSLLALALWGYWHRNPALPWAALSGVYGGCVGGIFANIFKVIVGRPRPCTPHPDSINWFTFGWDFASFPSGHASHCMGVAAAVVVLAPRSGIALILGSLLVGWSRWYSLRHYWTDVWAGSCLGLAIGLLFGLAAKRLLDHPTKAVAPISEQAEAKR